MLFRDTTLAAKITAVVKESHLSTEAGALEDVFLQTAFHTLQFRILPVEMYLKLTKCIHDFGRYHQS